MIYQFFMGFEVYFLFNWTVYIFFIIKSIFNVKFQVKKKKN